MRQENAVGISKMLDSNFCSKPISLIAHCVVRLCRTIVPIVAATIETIVRHSGLLHIHAGD